MKRKVKILRNIGTDFSPPGYPAGSFKHLKEGQIVDLSEKEAEQLLGATLAEVVEHEIDIPKSEEKKK